MSNTARKIFSPILNIFENDSNEFQLTPTNRKVVLAISTCMLLLSALLVYIGVKQQLNGVILPLIVFLSVSIVGLVVGSLGSDHAVAKLIGNRKK